MSGNVAQTVQKAIHDVVTPDLRELKVTVAANQNQNELQSDALSATVAANQTHTDQQFSSMQKQMDHRFDAQDAKAEFMFKSLMSAIAGVKAQNNLAILQAISALSGRVAILVTRVH